MTTIAWTPGYFASDSCLTQETDDGRHALNRTYIKKLKYRKSYNGQRPVEGTVIVTASAGDGVAGEALDALLLDQAWKILRAGGGGLEAQMNKPALLKARKDIMADASKVEALLVWMPPAGGDCVYYIDGTGRIKYQSEQYIAIGIDAGVALGALHAGANAVQAVTAAAYHGVYSALPVHYAARVDGEIEIGEFK